MSHVARLALFLLPFLVVPLLLLRPARADGEGNGSPGWSPASPVEGRKPLPPPRVIPGPRPGAPAPANPTPPATPTTQTPPPAVPPVSSPPPTAPAAPASQTPAWNFDALAPGNELEPLSPQPLDLWDLKGLLEMRPRHSAVLHVGKHHNRPWIGNWKALDLDILLLSIGEQGHDVGASVTFYAKKTGLPLPTVLQPYDDGQGHVSIYTKAIPMTRRFALLRTTLKIPYRAFPWPTTAAGYEVEARVRFLRRLPDGSVSLIAKGSTRFTIEVDRDCPRALTACDLYRRSLPHWRRAINWDAQQMFHEELAPITHGQPNPHVIGAHEHEWYERPGSRR